MTWLLGAGFELQMAGSVTLCDVVIAVGDSTKSTFEFLAELSFRACLGWSYCRLGALMFLKKHPSPMLIRLLCACADRPIADGSLLNFMCQISTFGISLVKLEVDIRQELNRQDDVLETITKHKGVESCQDWSK